MAKNKQEKAKRRESLRQIFGLLKPVRGSLAFSLFCGVCSSLSALFIPVIIGQGLDRIEEIKTQGLTPIRNLCILLGGLIAVSAFFTWMMHVSAKKSVVNSITGLKNQALEKICFGKLEHLDTYASGDLANRIVNDGGVLMDGLNQFFISFLPGIITILTTLGIMLTLNPLITAIIVLTTPLSMFLTYYVSKKSKVLFVKQQKTSNRMNGYIKERIAQTNVMKTGHMQAVSTAEVADLTDDYSKAGARALFYSSLANPATRFLNGIVVVLICAIGGAMVSRGVLTIGAFTTFIFYSNQFSKPFNEISGVITQITQATAASENLNALTKIADEPAQGETLPEDANPGHIQFEDVCFSYDKSRSFIRDLSMEIGKGQRVAIVGQTGSGKTTLMNLLMRFYDIDGGRILLDGKDIKSLSLGCLRQHMGIVLQDTWLSGTTVREHITYGKQVSDEEIDRILGEFGFTPDMLNLEDGYDTKIVSGGANLSNGQKQLLCLARLMVAQPDILILDEATSDMDSRTEAVMQKAMESLMNRCTSIVVAHRLSTIVESDLILVMQNGKIVEQGTHKDLLAKQGEYASIYNSQFVLPGA